MKKISTITILLLNALFAFSQVTYQYDNLNRLQKVTYPNGTTVDYTYDELGNRISKTVSGTVIRVTVTANDAGMGSVTGSGDYAANSAVTISATPNTGYRFVQWNDGNTDNPRSITVTQDISFTASFETIICHVSLSANDAAMGSVTGSGDYAANSAVTISATPNPGYRFVQWNDGNTDNPRLITVLSDTAFIAMFDVETGITDRKTSTIDIYPNPATDHITVVLPENVSQAVFTLYDTQDKMLIRREINSREEISVSKLVPGIYLYHVRTEKESYTGKIIRK
jgi:YD repeat-containing protein